MYRITRRHLAVSGGAAMALSWAPIARAASDALDDIMAAGRIRAGSKARAEGSGRSLEIRALEVRQTWVSPVSKSRPGIPPAQEARPYEQSPPNHHSFFSTSSASAGLVLLSPLQSSPGPCSEFSRMLFPLRFTPERTRS